MGASTKKANEKILDNNQTNNIDLSELIIKIDNLYEKYEKMMSEKKNKNLSEVIETKEKYTKYTTLYNDTVGRKCWKTTLK